MSPEAAPSLVTKVALHEQRLNGHDDLIERAITKMDELKTGLLQASVVIIVALIGGSVALH